MKNKKFEIINLANYHYYPPKHLQDNLEKIIIFPENNKKYDIPNGSVFIYNKKSYYKPEILKSDVGCGMTSFITEYIDIDKKFIKELSDYLDKENINLGGGNHFLNIAEEHPLISDTGYPSNNYSQIIVHTDFNLEKYTPKNYKEAKDMIKNTRKKRVNLLYKLTKSLGINGEFYKDWTHNTVEIEDNKFVYRKGAINLKKTKNMGLLALNHYDGFFFYISEFEEYKNSMQHGTGKKNEIKTIYNEIKKIKYGKKIFYLPEKSSKPKDLYKEYNRPSIFYDKFNLEFLPLGISKNRLVIKF